MNCRQCGNANPEQNFYCGRCGTPLLQRPTPQPPGADSSAARPSRFRLADALAQSDDVPGHGALNETRRAASAPEADGEAAISGPSFLGLGKAAASSAELEYLYDDEPRRARGWLLLAVLLLAGLAALLAYQWNQLPGWYAAILQPVNGRTEQKSPVNAPAAQTSVPGNAPTVPLAGSAVGSAPNVPQKGATNATAANPAAAGGEAVTAAGVMGLTEQAAKAVAKEPTTPGGPLASSVGTKAAPPEAMTLEQTPLPRRAPTAEPGEELFVRGQAYLSGHGVANSCTNAVTYLNRAARMGNTKAASQLGGLYATGHCVPLDRARAYQYFKQAQGSGSANVYVERSRNLMWRQMTEDEKARAER